MKRFLLFYYENFYPSGGSDEVLGSSDSLDDFPKLMDAKEKAKMFLLEIL